ncbi:MAG: hypothetical protein IPN20_05050 [Haliscomenobacter sp.]|nr:hypothetical protein [Haliscomenobacter sp.]
MHDQIVSVGELVSSRIVQAYLHKKAACLRNGSTPATSSSPTTSSARGWVQWDETVDNARRLVPPMLAKGGFVAYPGLHQQHHRKLYHHPRPRGSDYTAAIFSFCLDAERMTIWKDVPGVLTADPRLFENVVKIDRLSYKEAREMTYYGAKVIHPKTIKPSKAKSIPLSVKSFIDPSGEDCTASPTKPKTSIRPWWPWR